jgi:hypothetical protein
VFPFAEIDSGLRFPNLGSQILFTKPEHFTSVAIAEVPNISVIGILCDVKKKNHSSICCAKTCLAVTNSKALLSNQTAKNDLLLNTLNKIRNRIPIFQSV